MSDTSSQPRPVGALLRVADYRRLLGAQAISGLGDWMATVALMALVFDITGSAVAVGAMLAIRLGPGAIAGPLAAQAARRWDRRKTMLAMDLLRTGVVVAIPMVRNLGWVLVWVFVLESATLIYLPARDALVPDLVERRDLRLANGLVLGAQYGGLPVGAGLFAAMVALTSGLAGVPGGRLGPVFFADALTFLGSFLLVRSISPSVVHVGEGAHEVRFRDALSIPLVRSALIPIAGVAAGLGTVFSVGIVFVQETLGAGDTEFALLIILFGVGALIGLGLVQMAASGDPFRDVRIGVLSLGVILALMGMSPSVSATLMGAVAFGAAAIAAIVSAVSGLQLALPEQQRLLAFTAFHIAVRVALGIGAVAAGTVADVLARWGVVDPVRLVLGGAGVMVALGILAVWGRLNVDPERL
jgi:predicted MFS family arabinose efflux permease